MIQAPGHACVTKKQSCIRMTPDDRIAMDPDDPFGEVSRNGRRQKFRPRIDRVDDREFDDRRVLTRPEGVVSGRHRGAVFAHRQEDILEALLVVPPAMALQDEGSLGAIGHDEAVDGVVNLVDV